MPENRDMQFDHDGFIACMFDGGDMTFDAVQSRIAAMELVHGVFF